MLGRPYKRVLCGVDSGHDDAQHLAPRTPDFVDVIVFVAATTDRKHDGGSLGSRTDAVEMLFFHPGACKTCGPECPL